MTSDILKSVNKIKISINENDQLIWECQASTKCYDTATEKRKEECNRLNKEIPKLEEEIHELEPKVEVLTSSYAQQSTNLALNQESLVNQRLYKKCITENIKKHKEAVDKIVDEYSQHFEGCKKKFQLTNPTYKTLETKETLLKESKITCQSLKQKIAELRKIKGQKKDIKQKQFYSDIFLFAKSCLNHNKYIEAKNRLNNERFLEKEHIHKLMQITESLKQKQKESRGRKESFKIPQIEVLKTEKKNDAPKTPVKVNKQLNHGLADIKNLLESRNSNSTSSNINQQNLLVPAEFQKTQFNANNSKVRILENKALELPYELEKSLKRPSITERKKVIAEKLQKVVQNFRKTISRQNSKKQLSQKSVQSDIKGNIVDEKLSQESKASNAKMDVEQFSQKSQMNTSGATQELQNLKIISQENKNPQTLFMCQGSNKNLIPKEINQTPEFYGTYVNQPAEYTVHKNSMLQKYDNGSKQNKLQTKENIVLPKVVSSCPTNTTDLTLKMGISPVNKMQKLQSFHDVKKTSNTVDINKSKEKPQFMMNTSMFNGYFNISKAYKASENKSNNIPEHLEQSENPGFLEKPSFLNTGFGNDQKIQNVNNAAGTRTPFESTSQFFKKFENNVFMDQPQLSQKSDNESNNLMNIASSGSLKGSQSQLENPGNNPVPSYNFGNPTQFSQMLNESCDYDGGYKSPEFNQSFIQSPQEDGNTSMPIEFGGSAGQPLFSFGQTGNAFCFN